MQLLFSNNPSPLQIIIIQTWAVKKNHCIIRDKNMEIGLGESGSFPLGMSLNVSSLCPQMHFTDTFVYYHW
jgi:hypothetical protein